LGERWSVLLIRRDWFSARRLSLVQRWVSFKEALSTSSWSLIDLYWPEPTTFYRSLSLSSRPSSQCLLRRGPDRVFVSCSAYLFPSLCLDIFSTTFRTACVTMFPLAMQTFDTDISFPFMIPCHMHGSIMRLLRLLILRHHALPGSRDHQSLGEVGCQSGC
jgi:hypothetical protein